MKKTPIFLKAYEPDGEARIDDVTLEVPDPSRRRLSCPMCSKCFDYGKNLKKHLSSHDLPPKTRFSCGRCDKVFGSKSTLHYHVQKHNNPTHQCSSCPRMFKSAKGLR